jgi:subtilase family serine protease
MRKKIFLLAVVMFVIFSITALAKVQPKDNFTATNQMKKKPDLVTLGMSINVNDGGALIAGKATMIGCSLKNNGGPFTTEFRIGIRIDGTPLGLPQGSTATPATTSFATPWTAVAGKHTATCILDTQNVVNESNESNNVAYLRLDVPKATLKPNVVVHDVVIPNHVNIGTDITIEKVEVKADDGGEVLDGKASRVFCYWKRTGVAPAADFRVAPYVDNVPIGLPQGSTVQHNMLNGWLSTPWTAKAASHTITCLADSAYQVAETDETNNSRTIGIDVMPAK